MPSVMIMSTTPVAAALTWNAGCGREIQLNICIGMTVNGAVNQSKLTNGNAGCTGDGGTGG